MKKFEGYIPNDAKFWNVQYAPERRHDYLTKVWSLCNTQRFDKMLDFVKEGDKFLDLGCGFGIGAKEVKKKYPKNEVWGSDQADIIINDLAKENTTIKFIVSELGDGKLPSNYFDVVFAGDIVEHLERPELLFEEAKRVLKVGGIFMLTTPDGEVKPYLVSPDHIWIFTHDDVDKLYKDSGFSSPPDYPYISGNEGVMVIFAKGEKL